MTARRANAAASASTSSPRPPVLKAPEASRLHGGSLTDVDLGGLEMRVLSGVGSLGGATISGEQFTEPAPLRPPTWGCGSSAGIAVRQRW